MAKNNPKDFLSAHPYPLIIDEAQKALELFDEIEGIINEIIKTYNNDGDETMFYYYRHFSQHEVDLVLVYLRYFSSNLRRRTFNCDVLTIYAVNEVFLIFKKSILISSIFLYNRFI